MGENSRVKNIKEKFEVLNVKSEPTIVSNKHDENNEFINSNNIILSKFSDHFTYEKQLNCATNVSTRHSRGSNVKRTPAFRRDKCISKFNSSSLAVNKQCTNVGAKIKQFDNFSNSTFASYNIKNISIDSQSEGKTVVSVNNKVSEMIVDNVKVSKSIPTVIEMPAQQLNGKLCENNTEKRYGTVIMNDIILREHSNTDAMREKFSLYESTDRAYTDETLKKILRSPLPSGPPPQKPPRVFVKEKITEKCENDKSELPITKLKKNTNLINSSLTCNITNDSNVKSAQCFASEKPDLAKHGKSKTELELMLKKLEIAFKKNGNVSPKSIDSVNNNVDNLVKLRKIEPKILNTVQSKKHEENIYAEPVIRSHSLGDSTQKNNYDEHIYEELDRKFRDDYYKHENKDKSKLYYMSTSVDSLLQRSPCSGAAEDWKVCVTLDQTSKEPMNSSIQNKRIRDWINDVYSKPWSKWSDDGSDSDSAISLTEEVPAHIVTDIVSDDFHEQLTQERKGYVRRVATRAVTRGHTLESISSNYKHIFECIILVGLDMDSANTKVPYVKMKFPPDANIPQRVEYLCFPDTHKWPIACSTIASENIEQCYTIILTTQSGQRKYGYCRRVLPEGATKPLPLAYCILSPHKAGQFYFNILEELESRHGQAEHEFTNFIRNLYNNELPTRGRGIKITANFLPDFQSSTTDVLEIFKRPLDNRLEDLQLSKTLSFLRLNIFLQIFSTLLIERKVILLSSSVSKLSTCVDGFQTALLPFNWQHTLISIVPSSVISVTDLCQAPTPYFIGLLKSCNSTREDIKLPSFDTIHEVVIVDIDENKILQKIGDENSILPYRLLKSLKSSLDNAHSTSAEINTYNLLACETFMRLFVELIGHYRHYIIVSEHAKKKFFQKEAFIRGTKSRNIRLFLEWFSETAMFTSFIESRLHLGPDSRGLFEQRCNEFHEEIDKLKHQKYKQSNKTIIKQLGDRIKDLTSA